MSESPHDPEPEPRRPDDGDEQQKPEDGRNEPEDDRREPEDERRTAEPQSGDDPDSGASEHTPERPPPYQGTYGAPPGQAPPAPAAPQAPAAGYGRPGGPGYPPPGHPQPGYQQPGYQQPGYGPPHPGVPYPGAAGPQDVLAGRWARLGAGVLDSLIISMVGTPAVLFAVRWDKMRESIESGEPVANPLELYNIPRLMVGYAIAFLVGFAYYTFMHARWGQTLGKKAFGIRLVRAADHSAVSWGQAIGRQAIVYGISVATMLINLFMPAGAALGVLGALDNAWILWDQKRQALHDKAVGTLVVKAEPWTPNPYDRS
ncbi:MAG TPA: RDD family protein [Spirillospora sp.]